jgi:hypothetical protein
MFVLMRSSPTPVMSVIALIGTGLFIFSISYLIYTMGVIEGLRVRILQIDGRDVDDDSDNSST